MKPVFINSSPNTQIDDILLAIKTLLNPFKWENYKEVEKLEKTFEEFFDNEGKVVAFDSARASFYQILEAMDIKNGDEVIVPAFTCTVIVNPILWVGAKPIYVDIDPVTLNPTIDQIKSKITSKTKLILAQHTFGNPVEIDKLMEIAKEKNIFVVEDCAHSLGGFYKGKKLGTWGDSAVFTFGITKVISGSRGGIALVKNDDIYNNLKLRQKALPAFPKGKLIKFLLNPIIWFFVTPLYYIGFGKVTIGKFVLFWLKLFGIIGIDNIVEPQEELGKKPKWYPTQMSPALSSLIINQLKKLDLLNDHRIKIAKIYSDNLYTPHFSNSINLRYPIYIKDKSIAMESFRKMHIIVGDWYKSILHIPKENYELLQYKAGSCPNAEYATENTINLPTSIKTSIESAEFIAQKAKEVIDTEFYKNNND